MNFDQGIEAFRTYYLGEGYSPETVKNMAYHLRSFTRFLRARGVRSWAELRPEHARDYQLEVLTKSPTHMTALRRMGDLLVREGILFESPVFSLVKMRRETLTPLEPLDVSEVKAILDACDLETRVGIRDHALISVMWEGCLNFTEAVRLSLGDLSEDRSILAIQGRSFVRGMPLSQEAQASLGRYLESARPYFLRYHPDEKALIVSANGRGFDARWARGIWPSIVGPYLQKARILKKVKGQALKWARIKYLLEQGVPEEEVRAMAGYGKCGFDAFVRRIRS